MKSIVISLEELVGYLPDYIAELSIYQLQSALEMSDIDYYTTFCQLSAVSSIVDTNRTKFSIYFCIYIQDGKGRFSNDTTLLFIHDKINIEELVALIIRWHKLKAFI